MRAAALSVGLVASLAVGACTTVPEWSGLLSDYSRQAAFDGQLSKRAAARPETQPPADAPLVFETVAYAPGVEDRSGLEPAALALVLNRFARDLCSTLADGFAISETASEGYRLRAYITELRPTGRIAAAISMPLDFMSPVGARVPLGLGALSAEVEIIGPDGVQVASMTWRRAASAADTGASFSPISDAYLLAGEAAESFGQVMSAQGDNAQDLVRVSGLDLSDALNPGGGTECRRYGQGPGLVATAIGIFAPVPLPPEWTDNRATRVGVITVSEPTGVDDVPAEQQTSPEASPDESEGPS